MKKHIVIAIGIAALSVPAIAQNIHRVPVGQVAPPVMEIDLSSLKALAASAEDIGAHSAFIGSPTVWSSDGKTSKPGAYLLDGGGIYVVPDQR